MQPTMTRSQPRPDVFPARCSVGDMSPDSPAAGPRRRIDSQALLGAAEEIEIGHRGQIYRLRRTALGKLILTK
jgi:hemin uptake protein HemP